MSDTRSPAVRAIDEMLEKYRSRTEIAQGDPTGLAIVTTIEVGIKAARAAVIAAEREAGK